MTGYPRSRDRAGTALTCLSADTDYLEVCLSARDLNTRLAQRKSTSAKMYRAGADHVVSPNKPRSWCAPRWRRSWT